VLVVLPTYNELPNIRDLVFLLLAVAPDLGVVIVDDNSPDGTGEAADALEQEHPGRVWVIHRRTKLGLGTAYLAGFAFGLDLGAELIVTMDADFSHHPRYLPSILEAAASGSDLVIGSRYVPGGACPDSPWRRRLISRVANMAAYALAGLTAHDATAGFRCYRRHLLLALPLASIRSSGYSFLLEILFLAQRPGFVISEVPIVFEDRTLGVSKISRQEIGKAIVTLLRLAWRRTTNRANSPVWR
jgi:glycosyltransferase involved in cell wall biosynthesis